MNRFINKWMNNRVFLFILPNLIYVYILSFLYNNNIKDYLSQTEVLLYEVIIISIIFFILYVFIYMFLKKVLKDGNKVFCITFVITFFYFFQFNLTTFLLFIVFILVLIIILKKLVSVDLSRLILILSFVIMLLFGSQFVITIYNVFYVSIKDRSYDYEMDFKIDSETSTPNIYWIHCDEMSNFSVMDNYFSYDNSELKNYFKNSNFVYGEDTLLVAGHRTQTSLVAMFNPYYYDNFFEKYLDELEKSFINSSKSSFIVDYYELEEKRLSNELMKALKEKGYSTVAIADFNQYTSLYTDYFYDFDNRYKYGEKVKEFRYIVGENQDELDLLSYIRFSHFKSLLSSTFFFPLVRDINYLDYSVLDYENNDISGYSYTDSSQYWVAKATLAGINDITKIKNKKFVFIDFKLNHFPMTFDKEGNFILNSDRNNPDFYGGNYIYSTKLLIEMLDYIKEKDSNAIIFVQGDHGIHMFDDDLLRDYFEVSQIELQNIRNSVISAYYIPDEYRNGDEEYLNNPLNISRYIVNNYVGDNYDYID